MQGAMWAAAQAAGSSMGDTEHAGDPHEEANFFNSLWLNLDVYLSNFWNTIKKKEDCLISCWQSGVLSPLTLTNHYLTIQDQCLLVKSDINQSPCSPREHPVQGCLCAPPNTPAYTQTKTVSQASDSSTTSLKRRFRAWGRSSLFYKAILGLLEIRQGLRSGHTQTPENWLNRTAAADFSFSYDWTADWQRSCEDSDSDGVCVLRGVHVYLELLSYLLFFGHKNWSELGLLNEKIVVFDLLFSSDIVI